MSSAAQKHSQSEVAIAQQHAKECGDRICGLKAKQTRKLIASLRAQLDASRERETVLVERVQALEDGQRSVNEGGGAPDAGDGGGDVDGSETAAIVDDEGDVKVVMEELIAKTLSQALDEEIRKNATLFAELEQLSEEAAAERKAARANERESARLREEAAVLRREMTYAEHAERAATDTVQTSTAKAEIENKVAADARAAVAAAEEAKACLLPRTRSVRRRWQRQWLRRQGRGREGPTRPRPSTRPAPRPPHYGVC